jgi:kinesin family protein 3/17
MSKKTETVKVAIRVRPMNATEKSKNSVNCVEIDRSNNTVTVLKSEGPADPKSFSFDAVYDQYSTQRSVYDEVAFPMVESVFEGYNGTIFAYGQTGCGKTWTMMGDMNVAEKMGIIPNTFNHIFGYINTEGIGKKYLVRCSFIEIYQEEIRDLQNSNSKNKLDLREDPKLGVFAKDLIMTQVSSAKELEKSLNLGNKNRHVGETLMNAESSRSHCIFTIYVEMMDEANTKNKKIKAGKLNLVDLAVL